ncbi:ATP synthase F1 subunit gamma [Spiroplasma turonicum]|uniref:ATP synthase gamma chain n=1 Tax=Spiroplasma turonicum TaxID=216946 RepID=A0A0K1P4S6_9MOLU|nr:ATP synthase F1 subunit gamma [Spiroplasma turonicum]AKU79296.1 F0F1 ATP synthase subunit gamma [Spiroplasma turonicum]ALX70319.1 F0F1 ATP synthase subunit gamma [Spiroplasma turonicum]
MANLSELKNELRSTKDIGKITGAMELVATAKLKKISKRLGNIQNYLTEVYEIFNYIISHTSDSNFMKRDGQVLSKTLWIVIGSNLGLCGGYNSSVLKLLKKHVGQQDLVFPIGTKVYNFAKFNNYNIYRSLTNIDVDFSNEQSRELSIWLLENYLKKEFDSIKIIYTKFVNNVTFDATVMNMLPIEVPKEKNDNDDLTLEPDASTVLQTSVTMYLNTILFGTIIESQVSEQASRRLAMESATKNGKEIADKLSILYNRKRQESITQEISEIVGGANAQNG